ncbi:MAG: ABC transporter ATP-binding protein [Pseudomonadota bacterium]
MTKQKALLEIENLMVFYENALAVNNISLSCLTGNITGVFGANSAGKTTLARSASGLIVHMRKKEAMRGGERISWYGEIKFNGESVLNLKPSARAKKGLILCPERRRIFPESSALQNLKIGGFLARKEEAKRTLAYVFDLFPELFKLRKRSGGFLSGGEQQMLAIGRALMAQPKLLMLDEPLLGLAPAVEERLSNAIKEINKELGLTVLLFEQYARPVLPIIDYCYVLESGGMVFEGSQEDFLNTPDALDAYFGGM